MKKKIEYHRKNPAGKLLELPENMRAIYEARRKSFETVPVNSDDIVFLGDSLTQRVPWETFAPNFVNRGIESDRINLLNKRIDEVLYGDPYKILILIGINNLYDGSKDRYILAEYKNIILKINRVTPNTQIIIENVPPVNKTIFHHPMSNKSIEKFNRKLKRLTNCLQVDILFVDLYSALVKNGELSAEFTDDGVHPNKAGADVYKKVLLDYVR